MRLEELVAAQAPGWLAYATLVVAAVAAVPGIIVLLKWREERRRPKVTLAQDAKTGELRLRIENRSSRPLQVRDIEVIPHGREPLPLAIDRSWSSQSPVGAHSSLVALADFDCIIRLTCYCQKLNPHGSVSVRGRFESGMGKQYRSKPIFYDAKTQRLSEKEPR